MPSSRRVLAGAAVTEETLPLLPPAAAASPAREKSLGYGLSSLAARQWLQPCRPTCGRLHRDSPRLDLTLLVFSLPSAAAGWMVTTQSEVCA